MDFEDEDKKDEDEGRGISLTVKKSPLLLCFLVRSLPSPSRLEGLVGAAASSSTARFELLVRLAGG